MDFQFFILQILQRQALICRNNFFVRARQHKVAEGAEDDHRRRREREAREQTVQLLGNGK